MQRLLPIHSSWLSGVSIGILTALLTLPLWSKGYLFGHDSITHLRWAHLFGEQFWGGELYPRWLNGVNGGQGSPVFFFYGPLPFWITSILPPWDEHTLETTAWKLGLSAFLSVFLSGFLFFAWMRRHVGAQVALAAAAVYVILPYHVLIDVHQRFAFAEFWSFTWAPVALLCADRILRGERFGFVGLAASNALLLMTHLPSTLLFGVVPILYLTTFASPQNRLRALAFGVGGCAAGAAVAAVYILPAMTMQQYVDMPNVQWSGMRNLYYNYLFYGPRFAEENIYNRSEFWKLLTHVALETSFTGLVCAALAWSGARRCPLVFWVSTLAFCLFMTHPWSKPIWQVIPLLPAVQLPWRIILVQTLAAAALFAYGLQTVLERPSWLRVSLAICAVVVPLVQWLPFVPELGQHMRTKFHPEDIGNYWEVLEYRPVDVSESQWTKFQAGTPTDPRPPLVTVSAGSGSVNVLSQSPRDILANISAQTKVTLVIRQFKFIAWHALLDGERDLPIEATAEGLISVNVPDGDHRVRLHLVAMAPERAGLWISAMSVVILLLHTVFGPGSGAAARKRL